MNLQVARLFIQRSDHSRSSCARLRHECKVLRVRIDEASEASNAGSIIGDNDIAPSACIQEHAVTQRGVGDGCSLEIDRTSIHILSRCYVLSYSLVVSVLGRSMFETCLDSVPIELVWSNFIRACTYILVRVTQHCNRCNLGQDQAASWRLFAWPIAYFV